jgi:hypothetical protein
MMRLTTRKKVWAVRQSERFDAPMDISYNFGTAHHHFTKWKISCYLRLAFPSTLW